MSKYSQSASQRQMKVPAVLSNLQLELLKLYANNIIRHYWRLYARE